MYAKMTDNADNMFTVLHMVGQAEDIDIVVSTATIAKWMNVSKQTALLRLAKYAGQNKLIKIEVTHRPNTKKFYWNLSSSARRSYEGGVYLKHYISYISKVKHVSDLKSQKGMFI